MFYNSSVVEMEDINNFVVCEGRNLEIMFY